MPDHMDRVQERLLEEQERLMQRRTVELKGRSDCADCGEEILPLRTAMGAQLCLDCQQGLEARQAHLAGWARHD